MSALSQYNSDVCSTLLNKCKTLQFGLIHDSAILEKCVRDRREYGRPFFISTVAYECYLHRLYRIADHFDFLRLDSVARMQR